MDPILVKKAELIRDTPLFSQQDDGESISTEKMNIFLVLAGLKPTGQVNSSHMEHIPGTNQYISKPDDAEEIKKFLSELGLEYEMIFDEYFTGAHISLSKDLLNKQIHKRYDPAHEKEFHKESGLLYGFPSTAVEAFVNGETLSPEVQQQLFKEQGIDPSLDWFFLSKDNYKEEIKTIKKWQDILVQYNLLHSN